MSFDAVMFTPLGALALSGGAAFGGCWAALRNTPRRLLLVAATWVCTSFVLWELTTSQLDWARSYWQQLLTFHAISSVVPAGLAFGLTRGVAGGTRRLRVGAIVVVVVVWSSLAILSAVNAGCLLDTHCY